MKCTMNVQMTGSARMGKGAKRDKAVQVYSIEGEEIGTTGERGNILGIGFSGGEMAGFLLALILPFVPGTQGQIERGDKSFSRIQLSLRVLPLPPHHFPPSISQLFIASLP